jgi:hypothetical protein
VQAGLQICETLESTRTPASAERERAYTVALSCEEDDDLAVVEVIAWPHGGARDAALRRDEAQSRPQARNHGTTWALGQLTISVAGEFDDDVAERVAEAMDGLGAS